MLPDEEPLLLSPEALESLEEDFDADEFQQHLASTREEAGVVETGVRPPNYHKSSDPETISCGNCVFFEKGQCTLYSVGVDKDWVSDAWTPQADF